VSPKAEHLVADNLLETAGKGQRYYHDRHADNGSHRCQPDNKPGKRFLLIECNSPGYKRCKVQTVTNLGSNVGAYQKQPIFFNVL
jgi:hypothetical protein